MWSVCRKRQRRVVRLRFARASAVAALRAFASAKASADRMARDLQIRSETTETLRQVPQFCGIPSHDGTQGDTLGEGSREGNVPFYQTNPPGGVFLMDGAARYLNDRHCALQFGGSTAAERRGYKGVKEW